MIHNQSYFEKSNFRIFSCPAVIELWEALAKNELNWRVSGDAFFNLSSITAGQENIIEFSFSKHD